MGKKLVILIIVVGIATASVYGFLRIRSRPVNNSQDSQPQSLETDDQETLSVLNKNQREGIITNLFADSIELSTSDLEVYRVQLVSETAFRLFVFDRATTQPAEIDFDVSFFDRGVAAVVTAINPIEEGNSFVAQEISLYIDR